MALEQCNVLNSFYNRDTSRISLNRNSSLNFSATDRFNDSSRFF